MCGIAGVLYTDSIRQPEPAILQAMAWAIAHRGPDAEGLWSAPGVGLAHRRLSIIDLAEVANQPLGNEDGSVQVVFNGEIYNFPELRADLEARGHRFRTNSDTEVLVHLYEEEGERLVERLRGMFAFALWDVSRRRLLLGRDRLGIKPLYVYRDAEKVLFGSELKAILAHPGVERSIDPGALEDYLAFGMTVGSRSIFKQIEKLPPAHTLLIDAGGKVHPPRCYWQLRFDPDDSLSEQAWQETVHAKLEETVARHLLADVPVGAFLSGGIDSGAMVAFAFSGRAGDGGPLHTFSIGFQEEAFSELPFARQVAQRFGTHHVEEVVTADAVRLLDQLTHHYDEPFADPSALPTFLVSEVAARHVKVVLSGDGGDEAFGGYARYAHDLREARLRGLLPGWLRHRLLGPLGAIWPKADWLPRPLRLKTALTNLSLESGPAYANTLSLCRLPLRRQLLAPDVLDMVNGHAPESVILQEHARAPREDALAGMLASDLATFLPDDFLVKVDRASMAHGLEVRPPLLDHELMELAVRIPSRLKVREGETKWILKKTVSPLLPRDVVWRPKQGFDLPIDDWLRGPLRETFEASVLSSGARVADLINQTTAHKLYRTHLSGLGQHGKVLWSLLVLARWSERYLGAQSIADCSLRIADWNNKKQHK
jgi:asparagine synthase (glutamine-hydrolysing)